MEPFRKKIVLLFALMFVLTFAVAQPFKFGIDTTAGMDVVPTVTNAIREGIDHEFEIHVYNETTGFPIITGITCYMHLYFKDGDHELILRQGTPSNIFDYGFDVLGSNFSQRGHYTAKYQCNSSNRGGAFEESFVVNGIGEELTTPTVYSYMFPSAFLFILAICVVYVSTFLPKGDSENEEGEIIQISQLKYLNPVLWTIAYLLIMMMVFIIGGFGEAYLTNALIGNSFMTLFTIMFAFLLVALPIYTVYLFYKMYRDGIKRQLIERGVTVHGKSF